MVNEELYSKDDNFLSRMSSIDSQTGNTQSSDEEPDPTIKTNLNEAQLVFFQSFGESLKADVFKSIFSDDNPCYIEFPDNYINLYASISLILPDKNEKHQCLKLGPVNGEYLKHERDIVFRIKDKKLNLDFIAIQFTDDQEDNKDLERAYVRNTARLRFKFYDENENVVELFKSKIIRNKNLPISEDISILRIKQDSRVLTKYRIRLNYKVPYFPTEMEIKIDGCNKTILPTTERGFPVREIIISVPEKIKCTKQNTSIICQEFKKSHIPKPIKQNPIIESMKEKVNQNYGESQTSLECNIDNPIQPLTQRAKEICLVMNQINFDNNNLKYRQLGSSKDITKIEKVFSEILNYDVQIYPDSTTKEFKEIIEDILENFKDYHEHIVVFVLSHGDNNGFHTRDGYIAFDEFVKLFSPRNYPQISDKPKLFFFSCCLGEKVNIVNQPSQLDNKNESILKIKDIPEYSNIFMGFSTVPGYQSFRSEDGTPYIQNFLGVLEKDPSLDITEIQNMTQIKSKNLSKKHFSIPCVHQCLTKKVYFKPKENN